MKDSLTRRNFLQSGSLAAVACALPYVVDAGGVPTFKPTPEQFKDFAQFIAAAQVSPSLLGSFSS